jgi:calcineurin-like phosphoesterase family protein
MESEHNSEHKINLAIIERLNGEVIFIVRYNTNDPPEELMNETFRLLTDYCIKKNMTIVDYEENSDITLEDFNEACERLSQ